MTNGRTDPENRVFENEMHWSRTDELFSRSRFCLQLGGSLDALYGVVLYNVRDSNGWHYHPSVSPSSYPAFRSDTRPYLVNVKLRTVSVSTQTVAQTERDMETAETTTFEFRALLVAADVR